MSFDLDPWASPLRAAVQQQLDVAFVNAWPQPFGEMCQHPVQTGGKRIRPLFAFGAAQVVNAERTPLVVAAATAVELVHLYSLVHDDLPTMDDDSVRRGQPTTHILYGEAFGLLVGDALLTRAFRLLSDPALGDAEVQLTLVHELSIAAGYQGMIGGQAADLGALGEITRVEDLMQLHQGKTGALIRAAVRMGALAAGVDADTLQRLTDYAESVGLAFQLADDVLDAEQDAGETGPPSYVKLLGAEETGRRAQALSERAERALSGLPRSDALAALARFTVQRTI